jgi:hypothetical protein
MMSWTTQQDGNPENGLPRARRATLDHEPFGGPSCLKMQRKLKEGTHGGQEEPYPPDPPLPGIA